MVSPIIKLLRTEGKRSRITKSEIRKDYLQDRYVLIAPRRAKRPTDTHPTATNHTGECAFCPQSLQKQQILKLYPGKKWRIAALKNWFPAVTPGNAAAYGKQEVVLETPVHARELQDLPTARIAELFKVYAERVRLLQRDPKINYILVLKNSGHDAGASIAHSHSQILGTQFVPPHILDKTDHEHRYQAIYGSCIYCDVLREEMRGPRKIYADRNVVVFAPYASTLAYEVCVMPRRHADNVAQLSPAERAAIARVLQKILRAVKTLGVSYNYWMHERVRDPDQHFYMKITPRQAVWGPVELGTGLIINAVPPEDAARFYREQFKKK
jgi:UDPglucose--hexose-1-phosphate uridylyltransferase